MSVEVAIEAGAELDRAVAEAIGLSVEEGSGTEGTKFLCVDREEYSRMMLPLGRQVLMANPMFHPSYDLNAAFAAAELVGLFDGNQLGKWTPREWCVILSCDEPDERDIIGRAETPALAICAAILEMQGAEARD